MLLRVEGGNPPFSASFCKSLVENPKTLGAWTPRPKNKALPDAMPLLGSQAVANCSASKGRRTGYLTWCGAL
jgi:hypothetical protein